ncbi:alternate F1F0 ATPase, F1 subunit alpha [Rhodopirellula sp. JC639]|uniref:alternate F1F0 ATPase, F1 subunit alpha n=1 Tax=Stieleria mannarensis TaxID=2755585 RepID=UPI0016041D9D|nr:alternate F1F0 ATPase, F1 subunit alpha [Rhodopirellula sp. JC639]
MNDTAPIDTAATAGFRDLVRQASTLFRQVVTEQRANVGARESGTVVEVSRGIVTVVGLPNVQSDELLRFAGDRYGFAFNLDRHRVGCVLLDEGESLQSGTTVQRTGRVLDTPVGEALLGRVIDPLGRPLDGGRRLSGLERQPCEHAAPEIMRRAAVSVPLQTGMKVIDGLIPIGRGQRQLVLGDRQTGKTSIAVDTIINQRDSGVICVYCSIGQRSTNVARVIASLRAHDAMDHAIVVIGADDAPPGVQFIAPYAATTIAEYFMQRGQDVLIVYDDLTSHARAYRHVSLLLRRPPGREAFPGDIFFVHSRLLERSTHLRDKDGGGSLTALPIIETEAQNVSGYIPTNLISITDGQIYLSPKLFHLGVLPAVDVGRSVSRVGGKTQLPAYRRVAGDLRLAYSQFEELEKFARFSSQLDDDTRRALDRGLRVREVLKQPRHELLSVPEQIGSMAALTSGAFDSISVEQIRAAEQMIHGGLREALPEVCDRIVAGEKMDDRDFKQLESFVRQTVSADVQVE